MKLKFVGDNNLYGLTTGKLYHVEIFSKNNLIWVKVEGRASAIPYSTPQAFAHNWE